MKNAELYFRVYLAVCILVLVIFFSIQIPIITERWCMDFNDEVKSESYSGKVVKIYLDSLDHLYPTFELSSGNDFKDSSAGDVLYKHIQVGDSVWKHMDSFDVYLKKYPSGKVYRFNIERDCN